MGAFLFVCLSVCLILKTSIRDFCVGISNGVRCRPLQAGPWALLSGLSG